MPEQTIERLINRIKTPLTLRDKQKSTIQSLTVKTRELEADTTETKK